MKGNRGGRFERSRSEGREQLESIGILERLDHRFEVTRRVTVEQCDTSD